MERVVVNFDVGHLKGVCPFLNGYRCNLTELNARIEHLEEQ